MSEIDEETIEAAAWIINRPAMSLKPEHYGSETLPPLAVAQQTIAREKARAVLALVLPAIERARVEERERLAAWHDKEAKRWNAELWDRRSWGGPTMGAEECINAEASHKAAAAAIRKG